jgi:hypothetical protein
MREVAEYYARLVSWYTRGGFKDEHGRWHDSGHRFTFDYWEVLNEVDIEHPMTRAFYTALDDEIVGALRRVSPETKFMGLSLASPELNPAFFAYFLDPGNHRPAISRDRISHHFYAVPAADETPEVWQFTFFEQVDRCLAVARYIDVIRQRLSPETGTAVNEVGTLSLEDIMRLTNPDHVGQLIPDSYWALSAALYAYVYAELSKLGIGVVAQSHLLGFPGFFPSCTMLDWKSGRPNLRYWGLKLVRDNFGPGDKLVETHVSLPYVYGQASVRKDGKRRLLLVNKRDRSFQITLPEDTPARIAWIDRTTGERPPESRRVAEGRSTLQGFAVAVISFSSP